MKIAVLMCAFVALFSAGCRNDQPPVISIICTLDGTGGGDCEFPDGTKVHKSPSEMKNFWATTQVDEANFASWCYKIPVSVTAKVLAQKKLELDAYFGRQVTSSN